VLLSFPPFDGFKARHQGGKWRKKFGRSFRLGLYRVIFLGDRSVDYTE
jgi:hypothetical protein